MGSKAGAGTPPPPTRLARFRLSRLPSHSTLAKLWQTRQALRHEEHGDSEWQEGDLLWAKLPSYPWWPCLVTKDPFTNQFVKQTNENNSEALSYHVQFFGVGGERSWVKSESIMEFKGRQEFIDRARDAPYRYTITSAWIQRLNFAIAQADRALPLSRPMRKRRFALKYVFGPSEKSLQRVLDNHFRYHHKN